MGLSVAEAAEGIVRIIDVKMEEAIKAISSEEQIDLLITDIVLGAMDGAGLACQLRIARPDLPVIYMSGYTADTDMVTTLRTQPGARFLEKPFRNVTLLERIAEALNRQTTDAE